jgi:hypothetical protein
LGDKLDYHRRQWNCYNYTKHLEVSFCYNFVNGVVDEGEDILLATKLDFLQLAW